MESERGSVNFIAQSSFNIVNALKGPKISATTADLVSLDKRLKHGQDRELSLVDAFGKIADCARATDWKSAFEYQLTLSQDLVQSFDYSSIHFLYIQLNNLVWLAKKADLAASTAAQQTQFLGDDGDDDNADSKTKNMESAARVIMRAFNYSLNDRAPLESSRKWATYPTLIIMFKAFIHLKTVNLMQNSLRALENAQMVEFPALEHHPKHISVAFHYYRAFYAFSSEQYKDAYKFFLLAFENCHKRHLVNKYLILKYLIPCAILNGRMPTARLMKKYCTLSAGDKQKLRTLRDIIRLYNEIISAVKTGNYWVFQRNMDVHEHFFLDHGVYMVLERLRVLCLARLMNKVYLIQEKKTRIDLTDLYFALRFSRYLFATMITDKVAGDKALVVESDLDEVECLVANLIYLGLIRGYLSHERRTLVLANKNPFPRYAEIIQRAGIPGL